MRPTPKYDTEATLNEICSREDYHYKRSLRNNLAPVFVPEPGKYDVAAIDPHSRKKKEKSKPQLTPLEIRIKQLRREQQQDMINDRLSRMARVEDKFAKMSEKENLVYPCVGNMAEKKLIYESSDRNKLAELNYLLHRKRDYTPERGQIATREKSPQKSEEKIISGFKKNRKSRLSPNMRTSTTQNTDNNHSGIPFLIGDTRVEDEIVLETAEGEPEKEPEIEVIKYDKPSAFDNLSNDDLVDLVETMEKEINDLKKDLEDEKLKNRDVGEKHPPQSLLQNIKNFLIRSIWDLGDLKNEVSEKDRRQLNLIDIIKRFDASLARQVAKSEPDLGLKLYERTKENENLLKIVDDLLDGYDKDLSEGTKTERNAHQVPRDSEIQRLVDQLDSVKAENELLSQFFTDFRVYDDSIIKLNNKQLLEKGSKVSIELLLRSLDKQTTELSEKSSLLKRHQEELLLLQKKVGQLESIHSALKEGYEKDTYSLLQLLMVGQEANRDSSVDQKQVIGLIRDKITSLKLQNEEEKSRSNILTQMEKVKDDEIKDLREKMLSLTHQIETITLEKAQIEEKLRFSELEKNNIQDVQFSSQEELKRRIKAENKKTVDELTEKVKSLSQKVAEQEQVIASMSIQLETSKGEHLGIDHETVKLAFDQLVAATYHQEIVSAFDQRVVSYLEEKIGADNIEVLLTYDSFVGRFKYLMNLLESLYQENLLRNQLVLKKCSNNLKVLHEYIRICEQIDTNQGQSLQGINQLKSLNIQKSYILDIIDEIKANMQANRELLRETQLENQESNWQTCIENTIRNNLRVHGMEEQEIVHIDTSNENLLHLWAEKFSENKDLYDFIFKKESSPTSGSQKTFEKVASEHEFKNPLRPETSGIGTSDRMKDDRKSTSNTMAAGLPGLGVIPEAVRKSEESGRSSITASFTQPNMGKKSQDASYKQEDLPRISIQPPINPVPAEPKNRFKEELQEEKRPSRFANCLGFTDENDVAKANKHHLDDASIITEGVDVYEKLRQEQNALQDHQNKNSAHQTSEKQAAQKGVGPAQKTQERMSAGATSKTSSKRGQALVGEELPEVEDNMISMLYQQARILENRLEKQRSLDS